MFLILNSNRERTRKDGGLSIKLRILQDCSEEEMALISAAVRAHYHSCETEGEGEPMSGWKFSGRGNWHGLGFFEKHSLRNSRMSSWRKAGLHRFG